MTWFNIGCRDICPGNCRKQIAETPQGRALDVAPAMEDDYKQTNIHSGEILGLLKQTTPCFHQG